MRRIKVLRISGPMLFGIFGEGDRAYRVMKDGIPPDAKVVFAEWDFLASELHVLLESEQFPEVEEGMPYPELDTRLETINPGPCEFEGGIPPGCGESPIKPALREISLTAQLSPTMERVMSQSETPDFGWVEEQFKKSLEWIDDFKAETQSAEPVPSQADELKPVKFREFL